MSLETYKQIAAPSGVRMMVCDACACQLIRECRAIPSAQEHGPNNTHYSRTQCDVCKKVDDCASKRVKPACVAVPAAPASPFAPFSPPFRYESGEVLDSGGLAVLTIKNDWALPREVDRIGHAVAAAMNGGK